MTLTDDDLKRLKDGNSRALKLTAQGQKIRARVHLDVEELDAIIARLEAAEAIAGFSDRNHPSDEHCGCHLCDFLKAWRKAAGK